MRSISISEVNCFYENQEKYFNEYILGIREKPNKAMIFGIIIHNMLANPEYDYKESINKNHFTSDFIRIADKINKEVPRSKNPEMKLKVAINDFEIYAGLDGIDEEEHIGTEYKTGSSLWTQERADESNQITHYSLAWWIKTGILPMFKLITISSKNGKHKVLYTKRTIEQLNEHLNLLDRFKLELIELGWWDKKTKLENRIEI